ncbi:multicopper oxidase family protein [Yoonia litorea]|uniref:Multicopper oxidase with three cupredoxin domains (Includes cell division protein FtsP and spore coat protein CotA) n=1 Tax=Yoonia litorea TaxID=1123755 RepID=A0A1I6N2Y5_9RHOB|nr:multicopper oxidase family protein [Yoonia litorea]SFS22345.1 Multicopper oxidase with three cupredoxin domains (includes cell division protein FtsP and spore coat protein CotA) [Yoonia litorea]
MGNINRRQLIGSAAALTFFPRYGAFADENADLLSAQEVSVQLLPDGYGTTNLWGYNGSAPGAEIRVTKGGRVTRTLRNGLSQPTSVHWHGIRIANAMDGVSGLTQDAVQPGDAFTYDFVAPDAGTYWYHAHNMSTQQVGMGLYGPLIVEEAVLPDIDREEVLVLDDWLINPDTAQLDPDFAAPHALSHAGRIGNYITTNGIANLTLPARKNERLRLRLINASNARIFPLELQGLDGWIVAMDGMPLAEPQKVAQAIVLGPAQRVDLIVDVTADVGDLAHLVYLERRDAFSQVAFAVSDEGASTTRPAPAALPPNHIAPVNLGEATALTLNMEGGAMGGLRAATLGGVQKSMREIVDAGRFWAFNGAVDGMEGPPLARLSLGETVRLTIRNDTAFPHAMHLHGMHFHEIGDDGSLGPLRDTTLLERSTTREIAFVADNPGEWLLHCHMLSHAASGMTTRIVVA